MWAEVDSTGTELYTQGSQPSGSNDNTLLVYDTADITASKAVGAPGAEDVVPEHAYPNVFTSGVTGAAYLNGRLYFASSSHVAGQLTDTFRIQSVDPHAFNPGDTDADRAVDIAATRRLEVELQVAGESEGLDFNGNLGGVLHWQIQPIPSDLVGQKPTYPPGIGTILSFVPDATATDVHDSDADGIPDADDACPDAAAGDQPDGCANGNPAPGNDPDRDGVVTASDNCADVPNNFQANADQDAQGDACDPDDDNDTVLDGPDNCDFSANPDQKDTDGDGIGDACSDDDDADTVVDWRDNCPLTPNPDQADSDGDGIGDACEDVTPPPTTDTTPPETTIGKIKVKKSTATIKFATTEPGGSFECKLDGKKVKKCAPPLKLKKLKPGKHRFEVAATDAAGNTDPTPAKAKFKVKKAKKGKHGGKGKGGK
ncbi:MAG: thrombospondin type 3 repeat-containing protein [Thermoleophilales bacterium]|nr:thrombospondin type 3 repeat-containing protein [Thermoleophilales bacterium]